MKADSINDKTHMSSVSIIDDYFISLNHSRPVYYFHSAVTLAFCQLGLKILSSHTDPTKPKDLPKALIQLLKYSSVLGFHVAKMMERKT